MLKLILYHIFVLPFLKKESFTLRMDYNVYTANQAELISIKNSVTSKEYLNITKIKRYEHAINYWLRFTPNFLGNSQQIFLIYSHKRKSMVVFFNGERITTIKNISIPKKHRIIGHRAFEYIAPNQTRMDVRIESLEFKPTEDGKSPFLY